MLIIGFGSKLKPLHQVGGRVTRLSNVRRLLVGLAAVALMIAVPTRAQAATGTFGYYTHDWQIITNPANGVCHSFNASAAVISNGTNTPAVVYQDFHCQVPIGTAAAGLELQVTASGSVMFAGV